MKDGQPFKMDQSFKKKDPYFIKKKSKPKKETHPKQGRRVKNSLQNYFVKNNVSFNIQNNKQVVGNILKDQSDWLHSMK